MKKTYQAIKGSLLIVEDEKIIAKDVSNILKKFGYIVPAIVSSGEEALKRLEDTQVDLVLMDIVLKGDLDGVDVAVQIYERFQIPVVFLTAYADDETLDRVKQTDPFGYLIKPFKERELYTAIEIALHKHKVALERHANEEKRLDDLRQNIQKLQQFSDVKDTLYKKFLQDLSGPLFNLNVAIHLLKETPSGIKREHYLRVLEEEFAREVELINQTANLGDLLNVENVELLSQFSLLRKQAAAPAAAISELPAASEPAPLAMRPIFPTLESRPPTRTLPRPLNQTQLADRLGVVVSAITYWKFKSGFPEWSRSKDPEGISWKYSPDSKRFSPSA